MCYAPEGTISAMDRGMSGLLRTVPCPTCNGKGTCQPIPVKGKQGIWEWTP